MIQLHHFRLSKAQLDAIPTPERVLIVLLSHAANELSVLTKLFHFCSSHEVDIPVLIEARNAQALVMGRLLTGKIYECWKLLQSAFFGSRVSKQYEPLFDREGAAALDNLKKYFGRKNLIEAVRNKFAFHYAPDQVQAGYDKLGEHDLLDVYLSKTNANTLYVFAETVTGRSLMESIDAEDHARSIGALIHETSQVIGWLNEMIGACLSTCLRLHVGGDLYALGATIVEVEGAPDWKNVMIPYFVEIAEQTDA